VLLDELRLGNVADLERVSLLQGRTYRPELDAGSILLEYFAVCDDLCVFVVSSDAVVGHRLMGGRRAVLALRRRPRRRHRQAHHELAPFSQALTESLGRAAVDLAQHGLRVHRPPEHTE